MNKSTLIPIIVFLITIISGGFVIYTSEQARTEPLTVETRAAGNCGDCRDETNQVPWTCPDGTVVTCTQTKKWYIDPFDSDACILCQDDLQCDCPQPTPTSPPATITPTPQATFTPTPTIARPNLCVEAYADPASISPGVLTTLNATALEPVTYFIFAFYNNENEYTPGNPKPLCVPGNGTTDGCPEGHVQLTYSKVLEVPSTTANIQLHFEEIFVPDFHADWNGTVPNSISVNAYFKKNDGGVSLPDENCIFDFSVAPTVAPSNSPTPTVTPTPTITPTLPPGVTPTVTPTPTSTPSPTNTPTPEPTSTPTPTSTNTPTPTETPTNTPVPTDTPVPPTLTPVPPTSTPIPTNTPIPETPIEPYCGDGIVQSGEQCDDGNDSNEDSCLNDCTPPVQTEVLPTQPPAPTNTPVPVLEVEGQQPGITPWFYVLIPIGLIMLGLLL